MKENIELAPDPCEETEIMDLGDAAEETRQYSPWKVAPDSVYGQGEWGT